MRIPVESNNVAADVAPRSWSFRDPRAAGTPNVPEEQRIGFRCGDDQPWLLMAAGVAAQIAIDPRTMRVPHTQVWFRGVMSLRGTLYPVFDIKAWLSGVASTLDKARILVVAPGETGAAVLFSDEPRLLQVRRSAGSMIDARLSPFTRCSFSAGSDMAIEFDHQKWFAEVGRAVAIRHA